MKQQFKEIKFSSDKANRLRQINSIIREYQQQGLKLTLRQLYYQLVSRDIIPNQQKEYAKLSGLLTQGRMAGVVDWDAIEDRLRVPSVPGSWDSPADILDMAARGYAKPRMEGQPNYVEVWVEKDALSGVLKRVTQKYHIPIVVNRGYSSTTAMYDAYNRFSPHDSIRVLYLGDHDPSGVDMIRDITERTNEFLGGGYDFAVIPIALTMEQITQYDPPPNPTKITDPRAGDYIAKYGNTCWEVDALRPEILNNILTENIIDLIDMDMYEAILEQEQIDKQKLLELKSKL